MLLEHLSAVYRPAGVHRRGLQPGPGNVVDVLEPGKLDRDAFLCRVDGFASATTFAGTSFEQSDDGVK